MTRTDETYLRFITYRNMVAFMQIKYKYIFFE